MSLITPQGYTPTSESDSEEAERLLCKKDLRFLCKEILGFEDWDICHDDYMNWYQQHIPEDKIILMPRNHLKSSIITIGQTIQDILNKPNAKILLASAVWDNARSFLVEINAYLTTGMLPKLFGEFKDASLTWNKDEITIRQRNKPDKTPTIDTAGIEKVLTSQHYDIIRADDLVTRETVNTKEQMLKVKRFHNDLLKLAHPKIGRVEVIGTNWHHADLYMELVHENKVRVEAGRKPKYSTYIKSATQDGTFNTPVIFPRMFNHEKLKDILFSIGSYDFSCNYLNKPQSDKDQMFKPPVRYWNDLGKNPQFFITIDLASSESETADFTVIMVTALNGSNQLCAVEYKRGHFTPSETIDHCFNLAMKYTYNQRSRKVGFESVAYQKVFGKLLQDECRKRNFFFEVTEIRPHRDKVLRITGALQPRWESGNLLLKQGMVELEDELAKFPLAKNDDILDTLEMATQMIEPKGYSQDRVYIPKRFRRRS